MRWNTPEVKLLGDEKIWRTRSYEMEHSWGIAGGPSPISPVSSFGGWPRACISCDKYLDLLKIYLCSECLSGEGRGGDNEDGLA